MTATSIEALRKRMAAGEPIEGDLSWCRRRLTILDDWPEPLNRQQIAEVAQLNEWLKEYAE